MFPSCLHDIFRQEVCTLELRNIIFVGMRTVSEACGPIMISETPSRISLILFVWSDASYCEMPSVVLRQWDSLPESTRERSSFVHFVPSVSYYIRPPFSVRICFHVTDDTENISAYYMHSHNTQGHFALMVRKWHFPRGSSLMNILCARASDQIILQKCHQHWNYNIA
jgi:hypothetical protein